jgi:hypothetical protein
MDDILDDLQGAAGTYVASRMDYLFNHPAAGPDPGGLEQQYPNHLTDAAQGALYLAGAKEALGHAVSEMFEDNDWRPAFLGAIADGILLQSSSVDPHAAVRAATTANITLSGEQTIDGVAVVAGDRVLVKDQTTGSQNGVYVAASGAWARAADMDTTGEIVHGTFVAVIEGTSHEGQSWIVTTDGTITIGTTATTWELYQGSQSISAGNGLVRVGNVFNVGAGTGIDVTADAVAISSSYAGQTSITTLGTIGTGIWQGTPVGVVYGGTGLNAYAVGDTLYASATNTMARLAGNATTTRKFLQQTGTGSASAAPTWDTLVDADIPATLVRTSRNIATTGPLAGGGSLAADRTLSITGLSGFGSSNQMPGVNAAANAWEYKSFAGTANRLTVVPTPGAYTWDIAATYVGQTSITTLGTITTGTWNGATITLAYGGTGISSYAVGDMIYASGVSTLSRLLGNTTTTKKFLTQIGTGSASAAPAWDTIVNADIPAALTGKTYNGLILTALINGFSLAGGTTQRTLTVTLDASVAGTNTGDQYITLTGDVSAGPLTSGSFAATIVNNSVTLAKMADMATASFLGRNTAGTGDPEVLSVATTKTMLGITGTNTGDQTITLTGDVTGSGTGTFAATIANNAVTLAKMADMATASFLGRSTAGTGDPEVLSVATARSLLGLGVGDSPTFTGVTVSGLSPSLPVFTNASKQLVSNAMTGTGSVAMSASPTFTGTVTTAAISATTLATSLDITAGANIQLTGSIYVGTTQGILSTPVLTQRIVIVRQGATIRLGESSDWTDIFYDVASAGTHSFRSAGTAFATLTSTLTYLGSSITRVNSLAGPQGVVVASSDGTLSKSTGYSIGTGTTGTIPKWTASNTFGNSIITEGTGQINVAGHIALPFGSYFLHNGSGQTQIVLASGGTRYGTIQSDGPNRWGLGYQVSPSAALSTNSLIWDASGIVSVANGFMVGQLGTNPGAMLDVRTQDGHVSAMFGDSTGVGANRAGYIYFSEANFINFGYQINANAEGWINYFGYNNSTSQFRDLNIADGKGSRIAFFKGSAHRVILNNGTTDDSVGTLQVNGKIYATNFYNNPSFTSAVYNAEASSGAFWQASTGSVVHSRFAPDGHANPYNYFRRAVKIGASADASPIRSSYLLGLKSSSDSTYISIDKDSTSYEGGIDFLNAGTQLFAFYVDNAAGNYLQVLSYGAGETDTAPRMRFSQTSKDMWLAGSGGRVRVGDTTTPSATLDVAGTGYFSGNLMAGDRFIFSGSHDYYFAGSDNSMVLRITAGDITTYPRITMYGESNASAPGQLWLSAVGAGNQGIYIDGRLRLQNGLILDSLGRVNQPVVNGGTYDVTTRTRFVISSSSGSPTISLTGYDGQELWIINNTSNTVTISSSFAIPAFQSRKTVYDSAFGIWLLAQG